MRYRIARLAAATLVVAAASLTLVGLGPAGPAAAAACSTTTGVTVIADFDALGGGIQGTCVADGGGSRASDLFAAARLPLRYASRQPGFVCRVSEKPQSDPCVNTAPEDRFWGLWWSDGDPGSTWVFSSLGVTSLKIPNGGLVALAWDQQDGPRTPNASPARPRPTSTPNPGPTSIPTSRPSSAPTTRPASPPGATSTPAPGGAAPTTEPAPSSPQPPTGAPGETTGPTSSPSTKPDPTKPDPTKPDPTKKPRPGKATPTASPDPDAPATPGASDYPEVTEPEPVAADADEAAEGLPGWVAPVVVVVLFAGAGGVLLLRRRSDRP